MPGAFKKIRNEPAIDELSSEHRPFIRHNPRFVSVKQASANQATGPVFDEGLLRNKKKAPGLGAFFVFLACC